MQKCMKAIATIMLSVAVLCAAGCKKTDDPNDPNNGGNGGNNGGGNGGGGSTPTVPTEEGMYLGIIGFNEQLYQKDISLLNSSTKPAFTSFIGNLQQDDLTALYYADYTALQKLKDYPEPPTLTQVALVTFTDGIDNISTSNSMMDPNGYGSIASYRAALNTMIMGEQIHGKNISAYSIGLKGPDAQSNLNEFQTNINMLANSPNNAYLVEDMNIALQKFEEIANTLYSQNTTVNLKLRLPGGLDDGMTIRFTFDNTTDGNSSKYIQATYKRTTNNGRRLENITYQGFTQGASLLNSVSQSELGTYHWFEFERLSVPGTPNPVPISQDEINRLQLWKRQGSSWQLDTEYPIESSTEVTEKKNSALIMLVLDCTSSLANEFNPMKNAAVRFVETLVTSSGNHNGGGNGGGNNGGGDEPPQGIINGKFSVSASQKVYFSKGNLQYQASTNTWRFANRQYDFIGNDNANISQSSSGWIDLFGWGTSNFTHGATCYQPWATSQRYYDYYPYGSSSSNLYDQTGLADWGVNAISNGGNETRLWRTLTKDEWAFLLNNRYTVSGIRYAKAEVAGKNGIVLVPDNWNGSLNNPNNDAASYNDNVISSTTWNTLETNGAVFLPAAGSRAGTSVSGVGTDGYYWSSSYFNDQYASMLGFNATNLSPLQNDFRYYGQSVRVVCDTE